MATNVFSSFLEMVLNIVAGDHISDGLGTTCMFGKGLDSLLEFLN